MSKPVVYSEAEVRRWLQWLARNMQKHGQTIFMVEQLQPSWLDYREQMLLYLLVSNTLRYGILMLLGTFSFLALSLRGMGPGSGYIALWAIGCVLLPLAFAEVLGAITKGKRVWSGVLGAGGLFVYFVAVVSEYGDTNGPLSLASIAAAVITVAVAVRRAGRAIENYVQPVERVTLSWRTFVEGWSWWRFFFFVTYYLLYRFIKGCLNVVGSQTVGTKTRPNQGIWLSRSSSFYLLRPAIAVLTLAGVAAASLDPGSREDISQIFLFLGGPLVVISLTMSAWYGGLDFLDHFVLRGMLRMFGCAPLSYPALLDYAATELGFLQKVGGGYIFMHRYLLEYFAAADAPPVVAARPAVSSQA